MANRWNIPERLEKMGLAGRFRPTIGIYVKTFGYRVMTKLILAVMLLTFFIPTVYINDASAETWRAVARENYSGYLPRARAFGGSGRVDKKSKARRDALRICNQKLKKVRSGPKGKCKIQVVWPKDGRCWKVRRQKDKTVIRRLFPVSANGTE